ncbi:hypothetical protein SCWH03_32630 [Streptomyces pacificus]|uniref:Uncharacterized protein n=1 Tax=Streptomyces pacificus TaxID=2705029 RepID=A0A6A0AVQ9_9ACTN|nr:hypothetical protein SCWH03_32630 [Streptomyces pacificus]
MDRTPPVPPASAGPLACRAATPGAPEDRTAPLPDGDGFPATPHASTAARNQPLPESRRTAGRSAAALPFAAPGDIAAGGVPQTPPRQGRRYVAARTDADGVGRTPNASPGLRSREAGRGTA